MQTAKHAAATAKEKVGNATAKVEEKMDKAKASTQEKFDKAMAHDKPGREAAHERKEAKEAEAKEVKHEKKADNAVETQNMRVDIDRQHAAANAATAHAHNAGAPSVASTASATQPLNTNAPGANYGNNPLPTTTGHNTHATNYATAGVPAPTNPANTPSAY